MDRYNPDSIRYYFIANGPEKRDTDFSWADFIWRSNSELLGAWGNLVNRTLTFIHRYYRGVLPAGTLSADLVDRIETAYPSIGGKIEDGRLKEALSEAFDLVWFGNRYFDDQAV